MRRLAFVLWIFCSLPVLSRPASAGNVLVTLGGTYNPDLSYNDGIAFDGTNYTDLPPLLDLAALEGGTFTASFTIPATPTPTSQTGTHATYEVGPESSVQFTLFDAVGQVKYQSSGLSDYTVGNVYRFPYQGGNVDQVVYASLGGFDVLGVTLPPGINLLGPIAQLNFSNYSDPMHSHLSDFSFPADPATYLGFPERQFNVQVSFGDGDIENGVAPFRFFDTNAFYTVNSVQMTTVGVPEPSSLALVASTLLPLAVIVSRRRTACGRITRGRWRALAPDCLDRCISKPNNCVHLVW